MYVIKFFHRFQFYDYFLITNEIWHKRPTQFHTFV